MEKIIDLETEKKMRLSIDDLLSTFWKFTVEKLENEPNEPQTSHLRVVKEDKYFVCIFSI